MIAEDHVRRLGSQKGFFPLEILPSRMAGGPRIFGFLHGDFRLKHRGNPPTLMRRWSQIPGRKRYPFDYSNSAMQAAYEDSASGFLLDFPPRMISLPLSCPRFACAGSGAWRCNCTNCLQAADCGLS